MGAALVKRCFAADDALDGGSTLSTGRRRSPLAAATPVRVQDAAALARRARQLRQLELQMQQLKQLSSNVHTPLSRSLASSYSTTMSEGSFIGSQSCGDAYAAASAATLVYQQSQPQDDDILDMVMANAGLAFHPRQQWRGAPSQRRSTQQSTSLPIAADGGTPASAPPAARPSPMLRRSSTNSFRALLPDTYVLQEVLGSGTTSTCYRCERRADGAAFACKVIDKRRLALSTRQRHDIAFQLRREVDVLKRVDHPNIARLEEAFESDAYLILIMELLDGGELFDAIVERGRFSEREAVQVARAVLSAMQYIHSLGVVHRDLKPENMLLAAAPVTGEDGEEVLTVKIIDFGFAKFLAGEHATTTSFLGTGGYLAPEILMHHPYTAAVDMWAFGVLLYLLLCGRVRLTTLLAIYVGGGAVVP